MGEVLLGIWDGAPKWVWPLFFVLVFIGVMAMRDRNSSIIPYFFYPLFGFSAVNAVGDLAHVPANWAIFAIGYALGMVAAFRWQDGLIVEKIGWKMRLKGDRVTVVILMVIFFSNFLGGVLSAVAPEMRDAFGFTLFFAGVVGACSGSFTGRALRVVSLRGRVAV